MNTRVTLLVAGGAALVAAAVAPSMLAGAGSPAAGATATTTATTTEPAFVLPAGYHYLVDDTNRITVAVPDAWTDIATFPATIAGASVPGINAATDLQVWNDTFAAPGVLYAAFPYTSDPQTLINAHGLTAGCANNTVVPYADGVFTGSWAQWTDCGAGGAAEWHLIVASPADQAFTAVVQIQLTGPQDQQAFDVVLETFNVTPTATWPVAPTTAVTPTTALTIPSTAATTAPATTATSASVATTAFVPPPPTTNAAAATSTPPPSTTAPSTTTSPVAGTRLVDDTDFLTVTVPTDWTDQNLHASRHDDGSPRATITAAPNLDQFSNTFDAPGTHVVALPPTTDLAAMLRRFAYPGSCTDGGTTPYDDGRFVGERQVWLDCEGKTTRVVNVAARPSDNSFTLFVQVQQTASDDAVLEQILGSAGVVPGALYPVPSARQPLTPTGPVPPELLVAPAASLMTVTDSPGPLSVAVPSTWTDTDDTPQMNDDGSDRPRIAAAPVLADFYTEWEVPGAQVVAYPFASDPSTLLHNLGFADQCTDSGVLAFDNGTFTGLMQTWTACGGTASRNLLLAISPADQSATVYVEVQLPDADNTPLQAVLSSLRLA
jgi:hypothetical protein